MAMDMQMTMTGAPWLDQPVMLHSSRDDSCDLTPEQCAFRSGHWRYWYQADHVFALATVYFFIATIGIFIFGFWALRLAPASLRNQSWWQKLVGSLRFFSYRRYDKKVLGMYTPSLGVGALLVAGAVFFLAMTLGPQPYYWPTDASFGGSPPLATRAGWMAVACLPFLLILPTKFNMIAALTGVTHEKLIIFHKWVGWAMFSLALVHTFPFIVYNIQMGTMVEEWSTGVAYWTGVIAIIAEAYLQFMSVSWIRNRCYEFFKATHFIAAAVFFVFLFIHCDFRLSSWDYLIAAGILYALSLAVSQMRTYFEFGLKQANIVMLSDSLMKITIPTITEWRPAQHMFLRFITLGPHALTAHPFTVCSVPSTVASGRNTKLVFYVQPRGGFTGRLAKVATQKADHSVSVLMDGPYGGVRGRPLYTYDQSLVIACGAGAGFSLPFVMEAMQQWKSLPETGELSLKPTRKLQVVIATRDARLIEWYEEALLEFMEENGISMMPDHITISVYQTANPASDSRIATQSDDIENKGEKGASSARIVSERLPISVSFGRPDITTIVRDASLQPGITLGVAACGPSEVLLSAQNEAAAAQLRIVGGQWVAKEVYLHSETFSW